MLAPLLLHLLGVSMASSQFLTEQIPLCCPEGEYLQVQEDTSKWSKLGEHFETTCLPLPDNADTFTYDGFVTAANEGQPNDRHYRSYSDDDAVTPPVFHSTVRVEASQKIQMPTCRQGVRTTLVEEIYGKNSSDNLKTEKFGWHIGPGRVVGTGVEFEQVYRDDGEGSPLKICGGGFTDKQASGLCKLMGFKTGQAKYYDIPEDDVGKTLFNIKRICAYNDFTNCKVFRSRRKTITSVTECLRYDKRHFWKGGQFNTTAGIICSGFGE